MSDAKLDQSLANLGRALDRLEEALAEPESANRLVVDGTIQRFEFAIELLWKTLKRVLAAEGIETATPRETVRAAYQAHWLDEEAPWLGMLQDRNRTSLIYDEAMAHAIYRRIHGYAPLMRAVHGMLAARRT
jgi:nucleotidyltransferase substrate binding protein (TIGR01987 family)